MADHDLAGFARSTFTHAGKTRTIFRQGTGPAVIVTTEMPGISPKVTEFAERLVGIGCTKTRAALDQVLDLFREKLLAASP